MFQSVPLHVLLNQEQREGDDPFRVDRNVHFQYRKGSDHGSH